MADFIKVNFSMDVAQFIKSLSSRELADLMFHANQESIRRAEELVANTVLTQVETQLVARRDKIRFAKVIRERLGPDNIRLFDATHLYDAACAKIPASIERVHEKT